MALLEVEDLTVTLGGEETVQLVDEVSFSLDRGKTLCIVGESGSGKTVTAQTIMRLMEYVAPVSASGRVAFDGTDLLASPQSVMTRLRGWRIGMVFQECMEALNPTKRVGDQLVEVWQLHAHAMGETSPDAGRARALEMLTALEMPEPEVCFEKYPHQLSGGMQQRSMIAMALMCKPELLIADEPTTALDVTIQAEILRQLRSLQAEQGMAVLLITHDMGIAAELADDIAVMYAGKVVEIGPTRQILAQPRHPYTAGLLECVPRAERRVSGSLPTIPGGVPGPADRPEGCRFAPRCVNATDRCRSEQPELLQIADASTRKLACFNPIASPRAGAVPVAAADAQAHGTASPVVARLEHLSKHYANSARAGRGDKGAGIMAVDDVSIELRKGEMFGLVGETGSGKTTLGRMLAALESPTSGELTFGEMSIAKRLSRGQAKQFRQRVQLVFQDPYSSMDPRYSVEKVIAEPLGSLTSLNRSEIKARCRELLDAVGLPVSMATRPVDSLSGGQRQRVAIARAMAVRPELIVADEPTSALDVSVQGQVMNVLLDLQRKMQLTYLFITHNLSLVLSVADRVGVMYLGAMVEVASADQLAAAPAHPYTAELLAANPDPDAVLAGDEQSPEEERVSREGGDRTACRFRHRCPRAQEICGQARPALQPFGEGREVACHFPLLPVETSPTPTSPTQSPYATTN